VLADSNARLAAARRLTDRRARRDTGRFLAEGSPAVSEALGRPGSVVEVFGTISGLRRHAKLLAATEVPVYEISSKAAANLSETASPQGLVAVCRAVDVSLERALARDLRLVVVLVHANDPGNAGTIVRTADAAGADVVVFAGRSVDAYNGKAVRASAGSLFHLDIVVDVSPAEAIAAGRAAGLMVLAATGSGADDLDDLADSGALRAPTQWLFGNESNGLPAEVTEAADRSVRVPIHGRAESLNLAAAAAVCLYASAQAHRGK
jgi:TrmH family RNA methyltransferase